MYEYNDASNRFGLVDHCQDGMVKYVLAWQLQVAITINSATKNNVDSIISWKSLQSYIMYCDMLGIDFGVDIVFRVPCSSLADTALELITQGLMAKIESGA